MLGCASGSGFLAWMIVRHSWPAFQSNRYPDALPLFLGCVFAVFAATLIGVSIFGSDQKVKEYFDAVLRGL